MFKRTYITGAALALLLLGAIVLATSPSSVAQTDSSMSVAQENAIQFQVRIENISDESAFPGPLAPGVWAVHGTPDPLFTQGTPDRGMGLEAIAEDGDPSTLAVTLPGQAGVESSGVFNTPVGASGPGPLPPGQAYEFSFSTTMTTANLSLATMLVQSNDIFASADGEGIPLFNEDGTLMLGERDVTSYLTFWDAGTELNQAPGMGPSQAPRQSGSDTGAAEGVVHAFDDTTRALPLASGVVDVQVTEMGGTFTVTIENVSAGRGSISTPIAPVFYATHAMTWSLFTDGQPAGMEGLEVLAEDGSPGDLILSYTGAAGVGMVGAQDTPIGGSPGPAGPGQSYQFSLTPDASYPYLSLASMVVETNDVFVAFEPSGVALLDEMGAPRPAADVNADLQSMLAVWDAGTEANEVPGVGLNQAPRQPGPNVGPSDPITTVRRYADASNDLAGPWLGGFVDVQVVGRDGTIGPMFEVTVTNVSSTTVYPGLLTPVVWATHNQTASLFTEGIAASAGLEDLAEDGDPNTLLNELAFTPGVGNAGVQAVASTPGGTTVGPLAPGAWYAFSVMPDVDYPYLSLASMVVPSNDTFMAFGPEGIRLLTETGERRSNLLIAADVEISLAAWDAGTEHNQAGAAGPDQAPRQAGPDTGADEGSGLVRMLDDAVWRYPELANVLRVTITPVRYVIYLPAIMR